MNPSITAVAVALGITVIVGGTFKFTGKTPEQKLAYLEARKESFRECMQLASDNTKTEESTKGVVEACDKQSSNVTYHLR